ncbi:hypothetical protein D9758_001226 [Tetrapyrgos nigripes]|uniref:Asl1-like glycosyl hydrolase catalytic domain-containing protein n=1 Tax=Tetrapyrgos nigripes TaxID=182062 RepID=A0A8H5GSQ0_9AGAR|nr:hypothetical protein D9758_001226 [Tetrapyrgos nigripes]
MAALRLYNLLSLATIAILACSYGPEPVTALSNHHGLAARDGFRGHDALAKRKRSSSKRCKPRNPPTAALSSTSAAAPSSTSAAAPAATPTDNGNKDGDKDSSGGNTGTSDSGKNNNNNNGASSSGNKGGSSGSNSGSSSPSSSSQSSGASSGSGKACLAWPNGDDKSLSNYKTSKTNALYTWSPFIPDLARELGFDAWPMLWGPKQIPDFQRLVVAGYANVVLGFNEPDQAGQSNLSPQDAAGMWKQYIQPLKSQGYKLVSPAVTSDPAAKQWMKQFFDACDGCTFDAQAVHWYDTSFENLQSFLEGYHDMFNLPIWLTEFAYQSFTGGAQGDLATIQNFMGQATSWMDSQPWVEYYCWFGAMHDMQNVNAANQLMASNGGLTALGAQFVNS